MNSSEKEYPYWFGARLFSNVAKQIQAVVIAWQIYQLTKSPLALGLIGLAEAVPFLLVSLWAGHLVDRHEKRKFMLMAQGGLMLASVALVAISTMPKPPIILYYLVIAFVGLCTSFEMISFNAYAYTVVPKESFSRFAAVNLVVYQTSIILGPILGGWFLSHVTPAVPFSINIGLFVCAFLSVTRLSTHRAETAASEPTLKAIRSGVGFIVHHRLIMACMTLDMVGVLFGDAVALFPIFADKFGAGPIGFGLLRAAPAIGSAAVSMLQAMRPFIAATWKTLKTVVAAFGVCMILFALSPNIYWAILFLVVAGFVDGMSVITRQSVYQANTPGEFRGRVSAVTGIFIKTSNEIGAFESGLAARFFGAVPSVIFGASMTLLSVVVFRRLFRDVENTKMEPA